MVSKSLNESSQLKGGFILGAKDENLDFEMGPNTSAYKSCSANLNGETFVFGGFEGYNKQVTNLIQNK